MKNFIEKNKIYLIIGGLVLLFGLALFWPQNKSNKRQVTSNKGQTKIVGLPQRPKTVNFGEIKTEIPEKIRLLNSNYSIDENKINKLLADLGMAGAQITKNDEFYKIYRKEGLVLYVKLKDKQIDFQFPQDFKFQGKKDPNVSVKNFKDLMEIISNREIGEPWVKYFKDEFRAVPSDLEDADFLELYGNFLIDEIPILNYHGGPSIKAQYYLNGVLGRLTIYNLWDQPSEDRETTVKSKQEIVQSSPEGLPIFNIEGNKDFALSPQEEDINKIDGENYYTAYVFEPTNNKYFPYLIGKGKTTLKSGEGEVDFGVPLVK